MKIWMMAMLQLMLCGAFATGKGKAVLTGIIEGYEGDTVTLLVNDEILSGRYYMDGQLYTTVIKDRRFSFTVRLTEDFSYVTLDFLKKPLKGKKLAGYYLRPGDSITLNIGKDSTIFSGKGAMRWQCMYVLRQHEWPGWTKEEGMLLPKLPIYDHLILADKKRDSLQQVRRKIVSGYKQFLSRADVLRLQADEAGFRYESLYNTLNYHLADDKADVMALKAAYDQLAGHRKAEPVPAFAAVSEKYVNMLVSGVKLDVAFSGNTRNDDKKMFNAVLEAIGRRYKGRLREKLLTEYMLRRYKYSEGSLVVMKKMAATMQTERYKKVIQDIVAHRMPGTAAFDFAMPDAKGRVVRYRDFKGKAIVISVWASGCSYCVAFEQEMKGIRKEFAGTDVVFVSVCQDRTKGEWQRSLQKNIYCDSSEINLYGGEKGNAFSEYYSITSVPSFIITGKDGKIVSAAPPDPRIPANKIKLSALIKEAMR